MIGVEENVAAALENDNKFFGLETLSNTQDEAEGSTAKRPYVSKDWGEAEEEAETTGTADEGGAEGDNEAKIAVPATLQEIIAIFQRGCGCREKEHFSRLSAQRVLHSQEQLLAASRAEKDCLLLGLLSG